MSDEQFIQTQIKMLEAKQSSRLPGLLSQISQKIEANELTAVFLLTINARFQFLRSQMARLEPRLVYAYAQNRSILIRHLNFPAFHVIVVPYRVFYKSTEFYRRFAEQNRCALAFDLEESVPNSRLIRKFAEENPLLVKEIIEPLNG